MKITDTHTFFWKSKLGQWNMLPFIDDDGVQYNCAEQYMMAKKAILFKDTETYKLIMSEENPAKQKKLGRIIKNFDLKVWNKHCSEIVYQGNFLKFSQNKELFDILMKTPQTIFVEASPFDRIWGVGLGEDDPLILDPKNWKGLNLLGKVLTKLRDDFLKNN